MNDDEFTARDDVDAVLDAAFAEHDGELDIAVPAFSTLLAARQRRTRRNVALSSVAVVALGVTGVVASNVMGGGGADDRAASISVADTPTSAEMTTPSDPALDESADHLPDDPTTSAVTSEWFCREELGTDASGRELYADCAPAPDDELTDWACTDRLGLDEIGRVRFASCEPIGQLGPLPDQSPPLSPDELPLGSNRYVVAVGDDPQKLVTEFCVSLPELEDANGWADAGQEFPAPGVVILVPVIPDAELCQAGAYTIGPSDSTRIAVADRFCVSVVALDLANRDTDGYSSFAPGLEIVIPPSASDPC